MPELPVTCHLCHEAITEQPPGHWAPRRDWWTFTWDHVIPKSLGGGEERDNYAPAHSGGGPKGDTSSYCPRIGAGPHRHVFTAPS